MGLFFYWAGEGEREGSVWRLVAGWEVLGGAILCRHWLLVFAWFTSTFFRDMAKYSFLGECLSIAWCCVCTAMELGCFGGWARRSTLPLYSYELFPCRAQTY